MTHGPGRGAGTSQSSPRSYPVPLPPSPPNLYHAPPVQPQVAYGNIPYPQQRLPPVSPPYYLYPTQFHMPGPSQQSAPYPMNPQFYPHLPPLPYTYPPQYAAYYPPSRPPYESPRASDYTRSNSTPYRGPKHAHRQNLNSAPAHNLPQSYKRMASSSMVVPTSPFPVQTTSPAGPAALGSTLIPPPSTTPTLPEGQPVQSELPSDCLPHELPDQTSGAPITPNKSTPLVGFLDEITPENNIPLPRSLTDATYTILPSRPEDPSIAYGLTFSSRTKPPPQVVKFAFVAGSEVPGTPIVPGEPSIDDILTPETSATAEVPAAEEMELFALGKESKLDVAARIPDTSENQIEVSEGASITPSRSSVYSSTAPTPSSHTPSPSSPISTATSISVYPSTAKASPGLPLSGPPWPRPLTKSWADIAKKTQPFKPEVLPAGASKETTDSRDSCEGNGPAVEVLSNQHSLPSHPEPLQRSLPSLHTVLTASPSLSIPAPLTHPRGLVNSGNMCFANVVLQALLHTAPFYKLFDMIGRTLPADLRRRALVDATVGFLREFQLESDYPPLQRPPSSGKSTPMIAEQLRQLSWQQDSFIPQALYSALSENKRFDSMKGGLQEDAEEFLGFFLDTLHEELLTALTRLQATSSIGWATSTASHVPASMNEREVHRPVSPVNDDDNDGWMEVGKRNKVTQTRTTKAQESAITRIFGGKLRSVLRVPGLGKDSVTLEPYQPLQLDIQSDDVQNIEDALRHLTKAETVQVTSRGGTVHATKQVFIESLPPVLVIHLKRFIYDGSDVQKSNKVLIYQTLLEIPNDVLAPAQRSRARVQYRLYGVVYHHGKFASGGHYTLDILRQDCCEWLRIDDTQIEVIAESDVVAVAESDKALDRDKSAYILFYQRLHEEPRLAQVGPRTHPHSRQVNTTPRSKQLRPKNASS